MNPLLLENDTIIAIATPIGEGAINIIRVSGKNAIEFCDNIFIGRKKLTNVESHTIHYGKIVDSDNKIIDDVLVSVFRNPNSYTGEDSVEISTHGSSYISKTIIELFLKFDCRLAEPGEFTKRAFLNGKLDLSQAEAVVDVINSRTEASLRGARNQLDGLLSKKVNLLRNKLIETSSLVELELDFAEEDIQFLTLQDVENHIDNIKKEINKLLSTYSFGKILRDGVNVALVGKPNVGKSSLLNYFLKESRAIVSHIPGTTRDVITEEISIDGVLFKLFDTAGLRKSESEIEAEGINRSRDVVKNADLILFINDITEKFSRETLEILLRLNSEEKIITVFNKVDLQKEKTSDEGINISALTGKGIKSLLKVMKEKAISSQNYSEKNAVVSNLRHYDALKKANDFLDKAKDSIANQLSGEFVSIDLRNAENSLGEIIGKVTTDDILNNIFSKFCIGK